MGRAQWGAHTVSPGCTSPGKRGPRNSRKSDKWRGVYRGDEQGECDAVEGFPFGGTEVECGLFEGVVEGFETGLDDDHHIGDGEGDMGEDDGVKSESNVHVAEQPLEEGE